MVSRDNGAEEEILMVWKIVRQVVGAVLFVVGAFLFFAATVDLSRDIRIAGPMNFWPPPFWVYFPADVIFAGFAYGGMKLAGFNQAVRGLLTIIVGSLTLLFVVTNHINAPSGFSDGNHIAAEFESYVLAYTMTGCVLVVGLGLLIHWLTAARSRLDA